MAAAPVAPVDNQCLWLTSEGIKLEKKAADHETAGKSKEAAFDHKRAAGKFLEAALLVPDVNPDKEALTNYAEELKSRAVYLESLGEAPIGLPFEDFVGDLEITMDLSKGVEKPAEDDVSTLIAKGGTSGTTAPLSDEGLKLVMALRSTPDMRQFIDRILSSMGRRRVAGAGTDAEQEELLRGDLGFAALKESVRKAPWVELDIDPKMDKLDLAMKFEKEAHGLESAGNKEDAVETYNRALAVLQFVHKHDPRTKNAKIKDMIGKRLVEMETRIKSLGGVPVSA